jgi:YbbR domain-containing protein
MNALRRLLLHDWPAKLAALGLATVLYVGVSLSEATRTWSAPVTIEVLGAPDGGALLEAPGVVDRIEYQAAGDVADQLTNDSFRASIDLSGVQPHAGAEPVTVPVDVFPVDPRVRVTGYSPPGVSVRLDEVVSRGRPVVVDPGVVPEGIELGPIIAQPNQATLRGAASRLQNVRSVEGRFVVDASGINIDQDVTLEAFDEIGAVVPGIEIEPPTVRVSADVARQLAYATVPVLPVLTGEPARGKRVDDVSVAPATVTVSGESAAVRQLEAVSTVPLDISGQEVELVAEVPLDLPEEVTTTGEPEVSVIVTFTEAQGSRSFEVGPAITGARPGFSYRLDSPSLTVVLAGPLARLDEVDVADLVVEVPVDDLAVGDNAVMPVVRAPRELRIARLVPESVRVTVGPPS